MKELAAYSRTVGQGYNLFNKIDELNENRIFIKLREYEHLVGGWSGKTVAVLGLSFKPHTDDLRVAPSTKVIPQLLHEGAQVVAYDPLAMPAYRQQFGQPEGLTYADNVPQACTAADVVLLLIEWPELVEFDTTKCHLYLLVNVGGCLTLAINLILITFPHRYGSI